MVYHVESKSESIFHFQILSFLSFKILDPALHILYILAVPGETPAVGEGVGGGDVDYAEHVAILVGFCGEIIVDDDAELCASVVRSLCGIGICYDPFRYEGRGIIPQRETYNNVGIATETVILHFRIVQIAACVKRDETMFNHGSVTGNPHRCEVKTGGETERTIVEHLRFLIAPRIEYSVVS